MGTRTAQLTGPPGRFLTLEITGYKYPEETRSDWDANWLVARIDVGEGGRTWSFPNTGFAYWELTRFVDWLCGIADGELNLYERVENIDLLDVRVSGRGESAVLTATLKQKYSPRSAPEREPVIIEFRPGMQGIRRFAEEIEEALQLFPLRVVEEEGPATLAQDWAITRKWVRWE